MAVFCADFYQPKREDNESYLIGKEKRYQRESKLQREAIYNWVMSGKTIQTFLDENSEWWFFYHLSELRKGLFAWYPFEKNADLLEVDAKYGTLTDFFCDNCKTVVATESSYELAEIIAERHKEKNNLTVCAGAVEDFDYKKFYNRFDYIVLNNVLEHKGYGYKEHKSYIEYLQLIKSMLKPDGKILLVVDNRYGVKYFCGAPEKYTGQPFEGINQYPDGTSAYAFEKGELCDLLLEAGLHNNQFFYPIPDADFPQAIATDSSRDWDHFEERITFYDRVSETLVARERCLYRDFMRNGVLGYVSNTFMIEASVQMSKTHIEEAFISIDRGRKRSFSTLIQKDGTVVKKPVYEDGKSVINQCVKNILKLHNIGIPVVSHMVKQNQIIMPKIQAETLNSVMKRIVRSDVNKFFDLFDLLYQYILKSSTYVKGEFGAEGPILKECFFDMVPANCFYINNQLIFFDQEFVRENCSAKYVLYRAIKYVYMSMWDMEDLVPKEKLIQKYELESLWDKYENQEAMFIDSLKNIHKNNFLNQWNSIDGEQIYKSAHSLWNEIDLKPIRVIPKWIKEAQAVQIRLLEKISYICEKYGLKYYAFFGTLLGAVRHKGFIPWDDDTDILMFRKDYDKFLELAETEFQDDFFLQTMKSDRNGFFGGFSRLRYIKSTAIEIFHWSEQKNQGIWMDIIPLDNMPETSEIELIGTKITEIQKLLFAKVYKEETIFRGMNEEEFGKYKARAQHFDYEKLCEELENNCKYAKKSDKLTILAMYQPWGKYSPFTWEHFGEGVILPFEGINLRVPDKYDEILMWFYGEKYMAIPPVEEQILKHQILCRPNEEYSNYGNRLINSIDKSIQKRYIVIGMSDLASTFIEKHQDEIDIAFVADVDISQKKFWGYSTIDVTCINKDMEQEFCIIICDRYFVNYEKKLRETGITNYKIYVYNKWWLLDNN